MGFLCPDAGILLRYQLLIMSGRHCTAAYSFSVAQIQPLSCIFVPALDGDSKTPRYISRIERSRSAAMPESIPSPTSSGPTSTLRDIPRSTSFPPGGNFSGALNNYLQSQNQSHLLSWAEQLSAPPGEPQWTVQCKISGKVVGTGVATQKSAAKQAAARQACEVLLEM
ncbi:hypothetical protein BDN72DRAFT_837369 [Pluteus cervinus]|uniref:Uncharacterized protein n=1 Tax=Pluteus cervinus TaxID=181527 RepID=A0ACD3B051_9AGAR|nr:hypothetical protein BDN72DRAFT_837369 [Pluteus cervinus]